MSQAQVVLEADFRRDPAEAGWSGASHEGDGFAGAWILTRILNRIGLSRFFWHPPLAMLGLAALLSALIGLFVLAP